MPAEAPILVYTTRGEVNSVLGSVGVDLRVDDNDDGAVTDGITPPGSDNELLWLDDAIEEATDWFNDVALQFYTAEALETSRWVRRRVSYKAANVLSARRGNPELFCDKLERIEEELERLGKGLLHIPRLPKRANFSPSMSNTVVDHHYFKRKIRVDQETSVGGTDPSQDADWLVTIGGC